MSTTREHFTHEQIEARSYPYDYNLAVVRAMTARGEASARGPERKDAIEYISGDDVLRYIPRKGKWSGYEEVSDYVAQNVNKVANRKGMSLNQADAAALAHDITRMASAADYPDEPSYRTNIARLLVSHGADYGEYYLSKDFIYQLQEKADNCPGIAHEIGNYYSIRELLFCMRTSNPIEYVEESVNRALEVGKDKKSYVEKLNPTEPISEMFLNGLTDRHILHLMTRTPQTADEVLGRRLHCIINCKKIIL